MKRIFGELSANVSTLPKKQKLSQDGESRYEPSCDKENIRPGTSGSQPIKQKSLIDRPKLEKSKRENDDKDKLEIIKPTLAKDVTPDSVPATSLDFHFIELLKEIKSAEVLLEKRVCSQPSEKVDLSKRELLVDWMIGIQEKLRIDSNVLHLAVTILDCVLRIKSVSDETLQYSGAASFLLAWKFLNNSQLPVTTLKTISNDMIPGAFPNWWHTQLGFIAKHFIGPNGNSGVLPIKSKLQYYEKKVFRMNQFNVMYPDVITILYCDIKVVYKGKPNKRVYSAALYFLELMLLQYGFAIFPASDRVAISLYTALRLFDSPKVAEYANQLAKESKDAVIEQYEDFVEILRYLRTAEDYFLNTSLFKKFNHRRYYNISSHPILSTNPL